MSTRINGGEASGQRGPHAGALAIVHMALFAASLIVVAVMSGGSHFPSPFDGVEAAREFFARYMDALRIGAALQFGSAIPLGIFTATVVSRLRYLGMKVPGTLIALFGGIGASLFVGMSGLLQWVLSQPEVAGDTAVMRALQWMAFATGGPGYVVPMGLLLAGIAVPAGFGKLLPRWLVWAGLSVAAIAELSTFVLVVPAAVYLLPVARLFGLIWMVVVGFLLPRSRSAARSLA